jgi:hypothetical protein
MIPMARAITTEQKQAFEVGPQIRSSNTYMIVKNERSKRAILAALGDSELQKIWMQRCLIRNQLVKLYEILKYHILLLVERWGDFLKKSCL